MPRKSATSPTAKYHHFELASAAFQIGIVLASATIITGILALAWISGLLTLAGIAFTALGVVRAASVASALSTFVHARRPLCAGQRSQSQTSEFRVRGEARY